MILNKTFRYSYLTILILILIICIISINNTTAKVSVSSGEIKLGVIMYHGFTSDGEESEYVLNISDFEDDIIYLKKSGYTFILGSDVIDFIAGKKTLPAKSVMLTFDDGYLNNYTEALPILKKHNVKAVISPVMYFSENDNTNTKRNPSYSNINFEEIKKMQNSGLIEFQNHSYNLHSINTIRHGSGKSESESADEYRRIFFEDTMKSHKLLTQITGKEPEIYTYPFGNICDESKSMLWCMGYKMAFGCAEGFNYIKPHTDGLIVLRRFNRTPEKNVKDIFKY